MKNSKIEVGTIYQHKTMGFIMEVVQVTKNFISYKRPGTLIEITREKIDFLKDYKIKK